MNLKLLVSLLLLTLLSACGGKSGSVKLEVARSFATGNSQFDGGLYLRGRNLSTNEEFGIGLVAANSSSITLSFGIWEISAIGWDNDPDRFEGDNLCAIEKIDMKDPNQTLSLQVTAAKCADPAFASSAMTIPGPPFKFRPLNVQFCGALYDLANPTQVASAFSAGSCATYPAALQTHDVKAIRIVFDDKLPSQAASGGLDSGCLPLPTNTKQIPGLIPVTIKTYEKLDCLNSEIGSYHFPAGLEGTTIAQKDFDSILNAASGDLFLAAPVSKKGTTQFLTEIPGLLCNIVLPTTSSSCFALPSFMGGDQYVVQVGRNRIRIPGVTTASGPSWGANMANVSTSVIDGDLYISFDISNNTSASFTINSVPYSYSVKPDLVPISNLLAETIGFNPSSNTLFLDSMPDENDKDNEATGVFRDVTELLSPAIFGGFFWQSPCSTSAVSPISSTVSFYDEGVLKNYQVIMTNPPAGLPTYTRNAADPRGLTSTDQYHRRFLIREIQPPSTLKTRMILDIGCDGMDSINLATNVKVGHFESVHEKTDSTEAKVEHKRLFWNTTLQDKARFDYFDLEEKSTLAGTKFVVRSSFKRGEKLPNPANNESDFRLTDIHYEYMRDLTTNATSERLGNTIVDASTVGGNPTIRYSRSPSIELKNTSPFTPGTIFSAAPGEMQKQRYGTLGQTNERETIRHQTTGNSLSMFQLGANNDLRFEFLKGTNSYVVDWTVGTVLNHVTMDISSDGLKGIVAGIDPTYNLRVWVIDASQVTPVWVPYSIAATNLDRLKARIQNNLDYIVAGMSTSFILQYAYVPNAAGSFGTIFAPASAFHSSVNHSFKDFDIAEDSTSFYLFYSAMESTVPDYFVGYCVLNNASNACAGGDRTEFITTGTSPYSGITGHDFNSVSASNNDAGTALTFAYSRVTAAVFVERVVKAYSGSWATVATFAAASNYDYSIMGPLNSNWYDLTNYNSAATMFRLSVPYNPVSIPSFGLSYGALNPSNLLSPPGSPTTSVFTDQAYFEALSN